MNTPILNILTGIVLGLIIAGLWRILRDRGHRVFGVRDADTREVVTETLVNFRALKRLYMLHTGPSHQQVFRGGTVICSFDQQFLDKNPATAVLSCVVWGRVERLAAAQGLARRLKGLGYEATITEPLSDYPAGTFDFIMVRSNAFLGENAVAFRAHWMVMEWKRWRLGKIKFYQVFLPGLGR